MPSSGNPVFYGYYTLKMTYKSSIMNENVRKVEKIIAKIDTTQQTSVPFGQLQYYFGSVSDTKYPQT